MLLPAFLSAQQNDTIVVDKKVITLSKIIIRNNIDIPSFIEKVKTALAGETAPQAQAH